MTDIPQTERHIQRFPFLNVPDVLHPAIVHKGGYVFSGVDLLVHLQSYPKKLIMDFDAAFI